MITVVSAHCICVACPTTIVGRTATGATVYARYRFGHLSVRFDATQKPQHDGAAGREILAVDIGSKYDGCLDYQHLRVQTLGLVDWPAELTAPPMPTEADPDDTLTL